MRNCYMNEMGMLMGKVRSGVSEEEFEMVVSDEDDDDIDNVVAAAAANVEQQLNCREGCVGGKKEEH